MIKIIVFTLLMIPLLLVDSKVFLFVIAGLSPAYIAMIMDRRKDKSTGTTVTFFNLAGLTLYLVPMLEDLGHNNFNDVLHVTKFFVVYSFAAMGYVFVWLIPRLFVIYADYKNQLRAKSVSEKMAKLIEKWGVEIRQ